MSSQILAISAEERLEQIADTAVGTGSVKKGIAMSHQRKLQRQSDKKRPASVADLSSMGIKVVEA